MTYDEMNQFIRNYIENDNTGRAIMLSGAWGSGKSYYVKGKLKEYLESKDGGKHKCAIVSLYGLTSTSDISKAIYMELRSIKKETESEAGTTAKAVGKIVAKTIANGLASKIGFDIGNVSDEDLQKVYDSLDLTGKLVVLEDIERTKIDLIDLLGFVNNMCENDGVKILLVTNENELVSSQETTDDDGKKEIHYTDAAINYLHAKEKTVGDTIFFTCDYLSVIQQIIGSFGPYLSKYHNPESAEDIRDIFKLLLSANLRAFKYGCQKFKDIIDFITRNHISITDEIEKKVFYGIIAFTQRQSKGEELHFEARSYLSPLLGLDEKYPLFRFCYNYITEQILVKETIVEETGYYKEYLQYGEWNSGKDEDLNTIKQFFTKTEKEVMNALSKLPRKIMDGKIPYHDYGIIVNYIVALKYEANIESYYDIIIDRILTELRRIKKPIDFEALFSQGLELHNAEAKQAFEEKKNQMYQALTRSQDIDFSYNPNSINDCLKNNIEALKTNLPNNGFASKLDVDRFMIMIEKCTSNQLNQLRSMFISLYSKESIDRIIPPEIINADFTALTLLKKRLFRFYNKRNCPQYDNIHWMQINLFIHNILTIIGLIKSTHNITDSDTGLKSKNKA